MRNGTGLAIGFAALLLAAAAEAQDKRARADAPAARGSTMTKPSKPTLPFANGREFRTLDAYLAHLRDYAGPTDRPWYREVGPGLYRLERGNYRGDAPPQTFTREELERRFGFRR